MQPDEPRRDGAERQKVSTKEKKDDVDDGGKDVCEFNGGGSTSDDQSETDSGTDLKYIDRKPDEERRCGLMQTNHPVYNGVEEDSLEELIGYLGEDFGEVEGRDAVSAGGTLAKHNVALQREDGKDREEDGEGCVDGDDKEGADARKSAALIVGQTEECKTDNDE